jgi:hypothetical protein
MSCKIGSRDNVPMEMYSRFEFDICEQWNIFGAVLNSSFGLCHRTVML